jgi:hypothetical protein
VVLCCYCNQSVLLCSLRYLFSFCVFELLTAIQSCINYQVINPITCQPPLGLVTYSGKVQLMLLYRPSNRVFQKYKGEWVVRSRILQARRTRYCQYKNKDKVTNIESDSILVTVYQSRYYFQMDGRGTTNTSITTSSPTQWIQNTSISIMGNINRLVDFLQMDEIVIMKPTNTYYRMNNGKYM